MASSLNQVQLIGRLGRDPEVKNLTNGGAVANFSVATSEVWKDRDGEKKEKTEWHNIVVWNEKTIEFIEKYLKKGDLVRIEGKIQTRSWEKDGEKKYTTEIVIPKFASMEALMKLSFDNDNANSGGGSRSGGNSGGGRSSSRDDGGRNDDRGGRNDDRGGGRSASRSASRDDRGSDDRGGSGGGRSGGRAAARDDRPADDRDTGRRAVGNRNADMDDDIPF
jgi:single-strand DNA-binding protein